MEATLYEKLYDLFRPQAEEVRVDLITIGLGYTAVTTSDGGCGVSFTYFTRKAGCTVVKDPMDYEGRKAIHLLGLIHSEEWIERAVALALINALNHLRSAGMEEDRETILDRLAIAPQTKCAMVGYFGPLVRQIEEARGILEIVDESKGMGDQERFFNYLEKEAQALILTSTSIINGTAETILQRLGPQGNCMMIGPSTPMVPEVFRGLPVSFLGGTCVTDPAEVIRAVRHGKGTPVIHRYAKKVVAPVE